MNQRPFFSMLLRILALSVALPIGLNACVIDDGPRRRGAHRTDSSGPPSPGAAPTSPMLVIVDTGEVMTAVPGEGIGVFVEYAAGGKWRVAWTCDTAKSGHACDVFVSVTASVGAISSLDASELQGGVTSMPSESRATAQVTTSNEVHAISFMTDPGAVITLEAEVDGLKAEPTSNQSFFFFVQNGEINGGYHGSLTNPLQLKGDKP